MTTSLLARATVGAVAILALAGCTFSGSANLAVPASTIAEDAAGALEEQVGTRPDLDCGDDDVDVVEGTVVECILTDPTTGTMLDTTVTITTVDGADYTVSVEVADTPRE